MASIKRGRIRARVTKMEEEMKQAVESNDRELAEELLDKLKKCEGQLDELNDEIALTLKEDQIEEENKLVNHYEDFVDRWTTRLKRIVNGRITTGVVTEHKREITDECHDGSFTFSSGSAQGGMKLKGK